MTAGCTMSGGCWGEELRPVCGTYAGQDPVARHHLLGMSAHEHYHASTVSLPRRGRSFGPCQRIFSQAVL